MRSAAFYSSQPGDLAVNNMSLLIRHIRPSGSFLAAASRAGLGASGQELLWSLYDQGYQQRSIYLNQDASSAMLSFTPDAYLRSHKSLTDGISLRKGWVKITGAANAVQQVKDHTHSGNVYIDSTKTETVIIEE